MITGSCFSKLHPTYRHVYTVLYVYKRLYTNPVSLHVVVPLSTGFIQLKDNHLGTNAQNYWV